MTPKHSEFVADRPGALIAAVPAMLGFVPTKSLVLVSLEDGGPGAVMRADLSDVLAGDIDRLAQIAAGAAPEAAVAVIVDAEGAPCPVCNQDYLRLAEDLRFALADEQIDLLAVHVVDRIESGGRWHCVDGCGSAGEVDDPVVSPLTLAAVVEGRRLYGSREDLQKVIAADDEQALARVAELLAGLQAAGGRERAETPDGCTRRGVDTALAAVRQMSSGATLSDAEVAELGYILTDIIARDTLYALAVGQDAGQAETLWTVLSRRLPAPWRVEALALLAFSAYARGDGPLAGISLDEALRCGPEHRMAGMLNTALQSGMRPEQIRKLAQTGYRLAERLGVQLPPRQSRRQRAG